ncbi:Uncharacterised protein [Actinomyces denticolens]|uniref:hypothetical protein n=1 Tax=Actinomyces TaxID=1654 RepID=UPI000BBB03AD|nr:MULTISPECIES: hypothetical protein [Actinomyces]SUU09227.1 Uncharacterised protein [Actinomyces denticolens]
MSLPHDGSPPSAGSPEPDDPNVSSPIPPPGAQVVPSDALTAVTAGTPSMAAIPPLISTPSWIPVSPSDGFPRSAPTGSPYAPSGSDPFGAPIGRPIGPAAPVASVPVPAPARQTPPAPAKRGERGRTRLLLGALVLALAVAGAFGGILLGERVGGHGRASSITGASGAGAPSSTAPRGESSGAPSSAQDQRAPLPVAPTQTVGPAMVPVDAPAGSLPYASIYSPSLNISCELTATEVGCHVYERDYLSAGLVDCSSLTFAISADSAGSRLRCGEHFLSEAGIPSHELAYGLTAAYGASACRSEQSGMTCWNLATGHGFTVSRASYSQF